jgi:hypothetical protein
MPTPLVNPNLPMTPEQIAAREADDRTSRARQLSGLRPGARPGEARNPTGYNGRDKSKIVIEFLEMKDATKDKPRILVLLESMYVRAQLGHSVAMRALCEQYLGKPKQAIDVSSSDGSMSPQQMRDRETTAEMRTRLQAILDATKPADAQEQPKATDGPTDSAEKQPGAE